eukprot:5496063-Alexandrium_andersonii.AAC.1
MPWARACQEVSTCAHCQSEHLTAPGSVDAPGLCAPSVPPLSVTGWGTPCSLWSCSCARCLPKGPRH